MIEKIGAALILIIGICSFYTSNKRIIWISEILIIFIILALLAFHMPISGSISLFGFLMLFHMNYLAALDKEKKIARVHNKNILAKLCIWALSLMTIVAMSYLHIESDIKDFIIEIGKTEKYNLLIGLLLFITFIKRGSGWNTQH